MEAVRPVIVFGTRPELIKIAPVVRAWRQAGLDPLTVFTGQHGSLVEETLKGMDLGRMIRLELMTLNQRPEAVLARGIEQIGPVLAQHRADVVLVQGDTTSALAGALSAFYNRVPVAHVEAGLRTHDLSSPFPEEGHRQLIARLATWNFCPTRAEMDVLRSEGISASSLYETGNTVIDALRLECERQGIVIAPAHQSKQVLVTMHRRESFGGGLATIATAVSQLSDRCADLHFRLPLHPNPAVAAEVLPLLSGKANVEICEPLPYDQFVRALCEARFVISDSGGIQEEAPWLGRPVVVVREKTERPQAIEAGASFLAGSSDVRRIVETALPLAIDSPALRRASRRRTLFGDGHAAERIVGIIAAPVARAA